MYTNGHISKSGVVWTWFGYQIKAESVLLIMIQKLILLKMSLVPCFVRVPSYFPPFHFLRCYTLTGELHPNQKCAYFVLYLKIIITFWKYNICILIAYCPRNWKMELKFSMSSSCLFWSITQEPLGLLKFQCYFWVPWTIYYKIHMLFFKKVLIILR